MRKARVLVNGVKAGILEELENGRYKFSAWFKKALFWVADRVTKPTNRWYKSQLHRSSLKTQYFFMQRV